MKTKTKAQLMVELENAVAANQRLCEEREQLKREKIALEAKLEDVSTEFSRENIEMRQALGSAVEESESRRIRIEELSKALQTAIENSETRRGKIEFLEAAYKGMERDRDRVIQASRDNVALALCALNLGSWDWPVNTITMMPEDARRLRAQVAELKKVVGQMKGADDKTGT